MPNGKNTNNRMEYLKAWNAFAKPICDMTGMELHSFDPDIALINGPRFVQLSMWFVEKFNATYRTTSLHKCAVCGDEADGPFYCPDHKG